MTRTARHGFGIGLGVLFAVLFSGFVALGAWQVERLSWKLDLIARVDQRVHAVPVAAPGPPDWAGVTADRDEYRHVRLTGRFENDRETAVQASTRLGAGFWILTPLLLDNGTRVLVNRGFVPPEQRERTTRIEHEPGGRTTVIGLLRITEPGGGFLRHNDAAGNRWYSRDVAAIAASRGLANTAPFYVDAEAGPDGPSPADQPTPGLTVVEFHNSHLVYAITWFSLAALVAIGAVIAWRRSPDGGR